MNHGDESPMWSRHKGLVFDAAVAVALAALSISIFVQLTTRRDEAVNELAAVALLCAHTMPLVARRIFPTTVLGINVVSGIIFIALGYQPVSLGPAVLVALYSAASLRPVRESAIALAFTEFVAVGGYLLFQSEADASTHVGNALVMFVAWFLGTTTYSRRAYLAELEKRTHELERAREELAHAAVSQERLRIARELHDILAHSLSLIAVQSGVGAHVIDSRPDEAKRSLETVEATSKSALDEIRRVVGVLREGPEASPAEPTPGLADLDSLVSRAAKSGPDVTLQVYGEPSTPVPAGVQLSIYRLVQESLTNVIKHADSTYARVVITHAPGHVRVEVVDNGVTERKPSTGGHGLEGMRERVAMHGGSFEAGFLPERGFRVSAQIPLTEPIG